MRVLFLTAWYPHRRDDMEGLFVRKHALAAARFNEVHVLFVKAEEGLILPRGQRFEYVERSVENVREHYYYYPRPKRLVQKILRFFKVHRMAFRAYRKRYGKPDIVHVNVLTRCGAVARLWQLRYDIPYVVTEHWTRYYFPKPFRNFPHKALTRHIVRHAACVMPVSESLAESMRACGLKGRYKVVRNVVDDFFFAGPDAGPAARQDAGRNARQAARPEADTTDGPHLKTMVHVCCFCEEQKNNFGLLRSVKALDGRRKDFRLVFVGDGPDRARTEAYAAQLGLDPERVVFVGKRQPQELKAFLDDSRFMVAFSNYETASVVLYESLVCGRPVVATRTGGIPEIVNDSNGILVEPQDEQAMTNAMDRMLDRYGDYPAEALRQNAYRLFSFDAIGKAYMEIYREAVR